MARNKRTKATDITPKVKKHIHERDGEVCIICENARGTDVMHYIGRGVSGLGIPENLGLGCRQCHMEMDQGTKKKEHRKKFKRYLKSIYPEWDESKLRYKKYGGLF